MAAKTNNETASNFSVSIAETSKELSPKERVQIKDVSDTLKLESLIKTEPLIITVDWYAVLEVHNDKADNPDYTNYIIVAKDGRRFRTGSQTFFNSFKMIADEMLGIEVDFSVRWNFSLSYTLSFVSQYYASIMNYESDVVQTLSLRGDLNLTKNWKIAFTTGYDFESKKMSYTSLDIYRDLHCWEMRFNWVPFGYYKSWNFTINVKAGMLQDLKYNMRNSYQDNQNYIIQ